MFKKRLVIIFCLVFAMVMHTFPVMANDAYETIIDDSDEGIVRFYSEKYPEAAIETQVIMMNEVEIVGERAYARNFDPELSTYLMQNQEVNDKLVEVSSDETVLGVASATVYVSETYEMINGERVCIESRLLSEDELPQMSPLPDTGQTLNEVRDRKLTLTITLYRANYSNYAVEYGVEGEAAWDAPGSSNIGDGPAVIEDYIGFVWDEDAFTGAYDFRCGVVYTDNSSESGTTVERTGSAVVWRFNDFYVGKTARIINPVMRLYNMNAKNSETFVTLKYVHTYDTLDLQGSVTYPWGGEISFGVVEEHWDLVASWDRLPN